MNKLIFNWTILFLYMFLIFYFSSQDKIYILENTPDFNLRDKLLHVLEYGFLGFLTYNAFKQHEFLNKKLYFYVIMFAVIYAMSDELHQIFIPNREFSIFDFLADSLGSGLILVKKYI